MRRIVLVSGTSNTSLSKKISEFLDVPLVNPQLRKFANGEIYCEMEKNVRGADVFVIQSTSAPVNDNLMELLIMTEVNQSTSKIKKCGYTSVIKGYDELNQFT